MLKSKLLILGFSIGKKQERHQGNIDNSDVAHRAIKGKSLYINFCETPNLKPKCNNESGRQRRTSCTITLHFAHCTLHNHIAHFSLLFALCSLHHSARWPPIEVRRRAEKSQRAEKLRWIELKTVPKISLSPAHQNPRILSTVGGQGYALWDGVHWTGDRKSGAKSEKGRRKIWFPEWRQQNPRMHRSSSLTLQEQPGQV